VLATGGIENARIILSSLKLGTHSFSWAPVVGAGFYDHPKGVLCEVAKFDSKKLEVFFEKSIDQDRSYLAISLTGSVRRAQSLLHPYIRLQPEYPWDNNNTFMKLMDVRNRFTGKARRVSEKISFSSKIKDNIVGVIFFIWFHYLKVFSREVKYSKVKMYAHLDLRPMVGNRITLSDRFDDFGCELPQINLEIPDLEIKSLAYLYMSIKNYFNEEGIAQLGDVSEADIRSRVCFEASHHMGATRMGSDPLVSVVNSELQVHGIDNLSVVGTSVMPTGGNVNPTYTAVALTIRCADHLKKNML
jgi:choline dehydrogenase-like flavoprotein